MSHVEDIILQATYNINKWLGKYSTQIIKKKKKSTNQVNYWLYVTSLFSDDGPFLIGL